jgi:hypothetical protein
MIDSEAWPMRIEEWHGVSSCDCDCTSGVLWHTDDYAIWECVYCHATFTEDECPF